MAINELNTLLGINSTNPVTQYLATELSSVLGTTVKVSNASKNAYRNENGKVYLMDVDKDEKSQVRKGGFD